MKAEKKEGLYVNLRPIEVSDAAETFKWRSASRAKLLNSGAPSVEDQSRWILARPASEFNFIIELKSGESVGMLSLINIDLKNLHAETARFLIGEVNSVKGIPVAVEAMKLLYQIAFDGLRLKRLYGTVAFSNKLMIKWQKYLGMKEEGVLRQHYLINNEWQDAVVLGLLYKEYIEDVLPKLNSLIKT
jgi:RimJ/RimL family protein N-acetyltransferase